MFGLCEVVCNCFCYWSDKSGLWNIIRTTQIFSGYYQSFPQTAPQYFGAQTGVSVLQPWGLASCERLHAILLRIWLNHTCLFHIIPYLLTICACEKYNLPSRFPETLQFSFHILFEIVFLLLKEVADVCNSQDQHLLLLFLFFFMQNERKQNIFSSHFSIFLIYYNIFSFKVLWCFSLCR